MLNLLRSVYRLAQKTNELPTLKAVSKAFSARISSLFFSIRMLFAAIAALRFFSENFRIRSEYFLTCNLKLQCSQWRWSTQPMERKAPITPLLFILFYVNISWRKLYFGFWLYLFKSFNSLDFEQESFEGLLPPFPIISLELLADELVALEIHSNNTQH